MSNENELMAEMFIHEASTLIEQLENRIIESEATNSIDLAIDEIFRVMHTIKGNSMMMNYDGIAKTSHALEDLFDFIRSDKPDKMDFNKITDLVLETVDYIKAEIAKIENDEPLSENDELVQKINDQLDSLKFINDESNSEYDGSIVNNPSEEDSLIKVQVESEGQSFYEARIEFDDNAEMVNIRAFSIYNQLSNLTNNLISIPKDFEDVDSESVIKQKGLLILFSAVDNYEDIEKIFNEIPFVKNIYYQEITKDEYANYFSTKDNSKSDKEAKEKNKSKTKSNSKTNKVSTSEQNYISVKVKKLDRLMNLVTELVVTEAMVTRNPDLDGLHLDNFNKAVKQMRKVVNDLQDVVMEVRMVPLEMTFLKMNRLVRDMARKIEKKVNLELRGQHTEVDKSIIEHIADPLMHIIRNSVDHGIETPEIRAEKGKSETGTVILEAKRIGGEIHIIVKDDGKGLDKNRILQKAEQKELLYKDPSEYSEKEIFDLIFQPGFSTNDQATNFSGRGVGMDVVAKGIEKIGGKVQVLSEKDKGTEIIIRIPLTLAIVDCVLAGVGNTKYAIPITSVNQLLKVEKKEIIADPNGNEMILYNDKALKIIRTYRGVEKDETKVEEGILVLIENDEKAICYLVDEIIGEYQLVVKNFPKMIDDIAGISGCALLGNGDISLIVDPSRLFK